MACDGYHTHKSEDPNVSIGHWIIRYVAFIVALHRHLKLTIASQAITALNHVLLRPQPCQSAMLALTDLFPSLYGTPTVSSVREMTIQYMPPRQTI